MRWRCRYRALDLAGRVAVMGIVNVTPDSFSDGGRFVEPAAALAEARRHLAAGADLLDIGAESTRPGAAPVTADEQIRRLEPVLAPLAREAIVSVDTADAAVARFALEQGAHAINDVTALGDPGMAGVVAGSGAGLVLMHLRGTPRDMQDDPRYDDVAREVRAHLAARLERAVAEGIAAEAIALDPGIGFGKTAAHNLELIARLDELAGLGRPVLIGLSRKRFLAGDEGLPPEQRLEAGLAATAIAVFQGARIVRTHDVAATRRAVRIAEQARAARRD